MCGECTAHVPPQFIQVALALDFHTLVNADTYFHNTIHCVMSAAELQDTSIRQFDVQV